VVTGTVVLPKEGNVADFMKENFDLSGLSVRVTKAWSEDVPAVVEKLETAVGLTGEDYAEEYNLSRGRKTVEVVKLYPWYNKEFLFGYPALCLLGPKEGSLDDIKRKRLTDLKRWEGHLSSDDDRAGKLLTICINSKWRRIAEAYLERKLTPRNGCAIYYEVLAIKGETEERFKDGGIDLVVEVVCKGNGAMAAGLKPYEVIFLNRGVVAVASKNYLSQQRR